MVSVMVSGSSGLYRFGDFYSSQVSQKKDQQGVGRDVQVEIGQNYAAEIPNTQSKRRNENGNERSIREAQTLPALYQQNAQEPGAAGASENDPVSASASR